MSLDPRGPHDGVLANLSGGNGYVELKLHSDAGDLELWLASDPAMTRPIDLPFDSRITATFTSPQSRTITLAVRNTSQNEDEEGTPNLRSGRTNYFIFPGTSGSDAEWLTGEDFKGLVTVSFTGFTTSAFTLTPHAHDDAPGGHGHSHGGHGLSHGGRGSHDESDDQNVAGDGGSPATFRQRSRARRRAILAGLQSDKESASQAAFNKVAISAFISFAVSVGEMIGGILAGSIAVVSDSVHDILDSFGFVLSLMFLSCGRRPPSLVWSFGWRRAEVLGSIVSIMLIWGINVWIVWEASARILMIVHHDPKYQQVNGQLMFWMGILGFLANFVIMCVLGGHGHSHSGGHGHSHGGGGGGHGHEAKPAAAGHGHSHGGGGHGGHDGHGHSHGGGHGGHDGHEGKKEQDINVLTGFAHVIGHMVQDLGVIVGGAVIWGVPKAQLVDPIVTIVFSLVSFQPTIQLLRSTIRVLMQGTPEDVDFASITSRILRVPGIVSVHCLHVWAQSLGANFISVHAVVDPQRDKEMGRDAILEEVYLALDELKLHHGAVQLEDIPCADADSTSCFAYQDQEKKAIAHDEETGLLTSRSGSSSNYGALN